jgi:hypothetical protein
MLSWDVQAKMVFHTPGFLPEFTFLAAIIFLLLYFNKEILSSNFFTPTFYYKQQK